MDDHEEILLSPGAAKAIEEGRELLELRFKRVESDADSITLEGNINFWLEITDALYQASLVDDENSSLYDAFCSATGIERVEHDNDEL